MCVGRGGGGGGGGCWYGECREARTEARLFLCVVDWRRREGGTGEKRHSVSRVSKTSKETARALTVCGCIASTSEVYLTDKAMKAIVS